MLRKADIDTWDHQRFYDFFMFCLHFERFERETANLEVTLDKIKRLEKETLHLEEHPYQEFIFRIDRLTVKDDFNIMEFNRRMQMMILAVGKYVKERPHIIDDRIRILISNNARLNWCLSLVKEQATEAGTTIVVPYKHDDKGNIVTQASPDTIMMESIANVTSLIREISGSFTKAELKKMSTKDRISALSKLSFIYNIGKNFKPNRNVLKQINIIHGNTEDIEKSLLTMATEDNDD